MDKLNRAQKCSILGPQNLGSRGAWAPEPPWIHTCAWPGGVWLGMGACVAAGDLVWLGGMCGCGGPCVAGGHVWLGGAWLREGAWLRGHAWLGGMCGRGYAYLGVYMAGGVCMACGGMYGWGRHVWLDPHPPLPYGWQAGGTHPAGMLTC